ncbi:D-glycero-alpha-D-manno-heptose-1,7-bisphosphate 7-phosphatase [Candidatus Nucleicultrix amoebiphila]|jgi:D-glycero-D-manno-heptose 1,7-bisphosphate phosphatase|uniref:D-glycero-alpha-D-manno-heptose-1,7-bisphosphate 7-phosphatase n=1 Tax=Candidatus Nucleicultrix amoebiphila TaxID=1509244 RepID=UPI000A26D0C2|nr:HAD-IIIA family hydrolase [Candidatus Nucleicultrix amoebiphila]
MKHYKLILIDRDGVINDNSHYYVLNKSQFEMYPGVPEAIKKLNDLKVIVVVVTNQGCVGKGLISEEQLKNIHDHFKMCLEEKAAYVDDILYAVDSEFTPESRRKPNPHMLKEAMENFQISPEDTIIIGDDIKDLEAAQRAGCHSILVRTGHGQKMEKNLPQSLQPLYIADDLESAVNYLIS